MKLYYEEHIFSKIFHHNFDRHFEQFASSVQLEFHFHMIHYMDPIQTKGSGLNQRNIGFIQIICSFSNTLGCLINVRHTFINFKVFSHQYSLIRACTFIRFESIIAQTKIIAHFCKNYSGFIVKLMFFSTQQFYMDPYVYHFFKIFHPVCLLGPVRLLGTLEYIVSI